MYRTLFGILAVFAAVLLAVGFTFSKTVDRPADFRFSNDSEPKTLDPATMTGEPESRLCYALFEGLTRYDPKTLRPVPGVAESWDISPDGTIYTFHLRANARWSDGRPVTAHDFVYSWKRLVDPKLASEYSYLAFPIRFAEDVATFDGHAAAIEAKIAPGLAKLRKEQPGAVTAKAWQKFLAEARAHDALRAQSDPQVEELLARREGLIEEGELNAFGAALTRTRTALVEKAKTARARFGVDAGVLATSDRTLVVELRAPTPYFLSLTMFHTLLPAPRWVVEKHPDDWFLPETIVSNGPYRMTRWTVNSSIRLERSETYWGRDQVRLGAIEAVPVESDTTALNLYLTGAIDWLPKVYPRELGHLLRKRKDFYRNAGLVVYYYRINTTRKPLNDKRVRKALNLAIDRKLIVEQVTGVGELPAATFVPPGLPGYEPPASAIRLDVATARALLAEAGYPDGKGFPRIGILYNTMEMHKKIAEVIADQLRRNLGIEVEAYNQEWQAYQETTRQLDYDLARAGWIGDYLDPNTFLDLWLTNGGNNQTGFSSPLYDRLVRLAADVSPLLETPEPLLARLREPNAVRALLEPARSAALPEQKLAAREKIRMRLFREAESILVDDEFPIMPIYFYVNSGFVRENVRNFYTTLRFEDGTTGSNLQDLHPLRDIFLDRPRSGKPP